MKKRCNTSTEVYSRVVGYYRPVRNWNPGKREEYQERVTYVAPRKSPKGTKHDRV